VLDPYGASGTQEFFAVAVEAFFEKPKALKHCEPEVFQQMSVFFQLDPSTWK
jgi:Mlc titration factor MtfA (ptsG expression regulator)